MQRYIGIFNDSFPPILDGVTLTVENYVHWLRARNYNSCVVTPWNPVATQVPYEVIRYFSLPIRSRYPYRYGYPKLDPFVWRRLRRTPFRLVHSHCPFSSGRLAVYVKKKQGVPLIGTFHSKYESDLRHSFRYAPWCVPIIMKRILDFFNACDQVWIPQASVEETVREYGYKGPLEVVENGIDYADMVDGDIRKFKQEARRELGIPDNHLSLLFVGQHIWDKGIGVIADALEMVKGELDFTMNFVGNGYALEALREKIRACGLEGNVRINGVERDRHKLSRYYAAADLFLFPSFYDNAPLVVREAAAMGTPSILLNGSTASEVITDRVNGFLTDRTATDYADMLRRLDSDREEISRVAMGARQTLVRRWENVVDEVIDRYNTLLRQKNGRR